MNFRVASLLAVLLLGCSKTQMTARPDDAAKGGKGSPQLTFQKDIQPLLQEYCFSCHGEGKKKGDLALDIYKDEKAILADRKVWEKVLHNVVTREMPPEKKKQPSQSERDLLAEWIKSEIFQCDCNHPDPGRVTLHRLNRTEYNSTIRDLVGVNFQPADDFPQDDVGYGFDNIGDVLSYSWFSSMMGSHFYPDGLRCNGLNMTGKKVRDFLTVLIGNQAHGYLRMCPGRQHSLGPLACIAAPNPIDIKCRPDACALNGGS